MLEEVHMEFGSEREKRVFRGGELVGDQQPQRKKVVSVLLTFGACLHAGP